MTAVLSSYPFPVKRGWNIFRGQQEATTIPEKVLRVFGVLQEALRLEDIYSKHKQKATRVASSYSISPNRSEMFKGHQEATIYIV